MVQRTMCPSATFFSVCPTCPGLGSNLTIGSDIPQTDRLTHGTARHGTADFIHVLLILQHET
jgi:hypothetical protein